MTDLSDYQFSPLRGGEFTLLRGCRVGLSPILLLAAARGAPLEARLEHEFALRSELDAAWAARPAELTRYNGALALVLEDPGGEPLERLLGRPWAVLEFLNVAIPLVGALRQAHDRGLVHKDIKPANILADVTTSGAWLTGFGLASRAPRERQGPDPPEAIAGTLAYMAPEQTGRMNRSTDSRSDLYGLGVVLYEMLTGAPPFAASDPMELIHSHIARQPASPSERIGAIPAQLSAIVLKLLAKTPEQRYQTAAGLEADLRRCLTLYEAHGRIDPFPTGAEDVPDRLVIPKTLYGREAEIRILHAAFDRVAALGASEVVLVSGDSGAGKSALVNELRGAVISRRGLFASGKFDQYLRDVPYATLAQAFQGLVRNLLGQDETELRRWREALNQALGANGQLIVNLVPELELIIGKQPPVADLPAQDAQRRFQMVFRRFLGVFAGEAHPLVLFVDDLQWLDAATLELLEHLATHPDVKGLLLIGAYRLGKTGPSPQQRHVIEAIRASKTELCELSLAALSIDDLSQLVVDTLHCEPRRAQPLARLLHEKTAGNPFFAVQFLTSLAQEELLVFDSSGPAWRWDIDRIRAKSYSDNVVDLMTEKLGRLSDAARDVLKDLAGLGNTADVAILALVCGQSETFLHGVLTEAVGAGLIVSRGGAYAFLHDRIQQAAYSLIPEDRRSETHLRLGRALLEGLSADALNERVFDVASQFNRGAGELADPGEMSAVATLNLRAGRKAKASAAYASASAYLAAAAAQLGQDAWDRQYKLLFQLQLERAECEFLRGNLDATEQLIEKLIEHATSKLDIAAAGQLRVKLYSVKSDFTEAIACALTCLAALGIEIQADSTHDQMLAEFDDIWRALSGRPIESLLDLPPLTDPALIAAMHLSLQSIDAAYAGNFDNLPSVLLCRMVTLSLRHGVSGASAVACAYLADQLGSLFGRYSDGDRFAMVARDLIARHGFAAYEADVRLAMGLASMWTQPFGTVLDHLHAACRLTSEAGSVTRLCYTYPVIVQLLLIRGDPLETVWEEAEIGLDFAQAAGYGEIADLIVSQQRFIANMRGHTTTYSTFNDAQFDQDTFEAALKRSHMTSAYWMSKLKARFLSADYGQALAASKMLIPQALFGPGAALIRLEYCFYTALTLVALIDHATDDVRDEWRERLEPPRAQLHELAQINPPSFGDKYALVAAEIARIDGRDAEAMQFYEQAIQSARENGFVQHEALAYEVAARFYAARGLESIAQSFLRAARRGYLRWGAEGKVRQLEQLHPRLREATVPLGVTAGAPLGRLEAETVVKASQALSSETRLGELIQKLMRITLEHAGAERGLLVLLRSGEPKIQAAAITGRDGVVVTVQDRDVAASDLPLSMLHYVVRTHDGVALDDATLPNPYREDAYVQRNGVRSVLCLPIVNQATLIGALYLENNLTPYAFTSERVAMLEVLASQAAISLENARAEEQLRQAQADLAHASRVNTMGELTAALAHEVNQPITAAVANANACLRFLSGETPDLEGAREAAEAIVHAGRRTAEIVSRTRDSFKKRVPQSEPLDVDDVLRGTLALLESEARRHSVSVRTGLAAGSIAVMGDRVQLQQVIMNLVMNSIDAMKDVEGARELAIRSRATDEGRIEVSISDTGVGLPSQGADRIFDTFFTTKPDGTGMGLAISRSIVEAHGGRLWAEPNPPRGATFQFALPVVDEA